MHLEAVFQEIVSQKLQKGKGTGSSLDRAPLTILDSGALQPQKWQLIGIDCSTTAQASGCPQPALINYWTHSMQPAGILCPSQPR